jgi:mono/diheme cytochrome c family protein
MEVIVIKRKMIIAVILVLGLLLSACGSGKLADELTPIPTLAPGETPDLVAALQGEGEAEANGGEGEGMVTVEPGEDGEEGEAAATEAADGGEEAGGGGDPAAGETLFVETCAGCHGEADGAGPARVGMGERAVEHAQDGQTPEEYLHESIVDPSAYIVEGYPDIMPKNYEDTYDEQQINDMVAYLMTQ